MRSACRWDCSSCRITAATTCSLRRALPARMCWDYPVRASGPHRGWNIRIQREQPIMIRTDIRERVAVVALDLPSRGNALSDAMVAALEDGVQTALADTSVHALVLTSTGADFC